MTLSTYFPILFHLVMGDDRVFNHSLVYIVDGGEFPPAELESGRRTSGLRYVNLAAY